MPPFTSPLSKLQRQLSTIRFEHQHAGNVARWAGDPVERAEWNEQARVLLWQQIDAEEELRLATYDRSESTQRPLAAPPQPIAPYMAQQSFFRATLNY